MLPRDRQHGRIGMARIKLAYIGGGSTRAPGTLAALIAQASNFAGSEVVLVDIDPARLELVRSLAERMAAARGADVRVRATTERRLALQDCDAVLSSFRPGGLEARHIDESVPLKYGVIGQETQGPGGFFMALRSIHVVKDIVHEMESACPRAVLFNYTNPVNIVAEAVARHSDVRVVSLCEGPIIFPRMLARAAGLDPAAIEAVMIGLNHACWSVSHRYAGGELMPLVQRIWETKQDDAALSPFNRRTLELTATMESIPASYFHFYYYRDEIVEELRSRQTSRAQEIIASAPSYWKHYTEQAESASPQLDPAQSRGGIMELELAINVMDAMFNDRGQIWPVNIPNRGGIESLPDGMVVEGPARVDRFGFSQVPQGRLPRYVAGLVEALAEYQILAAQAGWSGNRRDALRALVANPLVPSLPIADAIYDEMSRAHRAHLPERLLA